MKLYYKIWVDLIVLAKKNPLRKEDWKWMVQLYMGMGMAINFITFMAIFQRNIIEYDFYWLNFLENSYINVLLNFFILFFLPAIIINYLFIFKNNKYEFLINKFKAHNGYLFAGYFGVSLFAPLFLLITLLIIRR
jgi:hypothetical protein